MRALRLLWGLLRWAPLGVLSRWVPFLPSLDTLVNAAAKLVAVAVRVLVTFVEGILDAFHHPKVLLVIVAAFFAGLYLPDRPPPTTAKKPVVERSIFRSIFSAPAAVTKHQPSPKSGAECVAPGLTPSGWCF